MNYKAESLKTKIGKGVKIIDGEKTYEQISCRDGLTARIFRTSSNETYKGILFKELKNNENDYKLFRRLTEGLAKVSGQEIKNSQPDFIDYTAYTGLEQTLQNINTTIKVRKEDGNAQDLPKKIRRFMNKKCRLSGTVADIVGYGSGFAALASIEPVLCGALVLGGLIFEGAIGIVLGEKIALNRKEIEENYGDPWCGSVHSLGYVPLKSVYIGKIKRPDYMLGKFLKAYGGLEKIKENASSHKRKYLGLRKKCDKYLELVEEIFPVSDFWQGISITHNNNDGEKILDLFSDII